ncbi:MAG TPA: hypothetical protein VN887_15200 [Candidatus Angelobacter sp.]|nr:hypothetical protein [Candidatus Angelobacter sp.]
MKTSRSHSKNSPASKARRKCVPSSLRIDHRATGPTLQRRHEFRAWRASLPTALERDTLLMPDAIAESVVQEAERFLKADQTGNICRSLNTSRS